MNSSFDSFTVEQQAHLLSIAGRLLSLWYMSGKTDVPDGFINLHSFAIFCAIQASDFHVYYDELNGAA